MIMVLIASELEFHSVIPLQFFNPLDKHTLFVKLRVLICEIS